MAATNAKFVAFKPGYNTWAADAGGSYIFNTIADAESAINFSGGAGSSTSGLWVITPVIQES